jgi:hypothetical protein
MTLCLPCKILDYACSYRQLIKSAGHAEPNIPAVIASFFAGNTSPMMPKATETADRVAPWITRLSSKK